jgi:hypothetical protein
MRSILFGLCLFLFAATFCVAEDILVSFLTTDSKLVVLKVNFANNKYTVVDRAIFNLTASGGLTAIAPLTGGNYQVAWNQRDNTNKIKALSMALNPSLDAVGTTKKNAPALTSFYNFNILPGGDQFSIDFQNNVMLRSRASNGNMGGSQGKLFNIPAGFDPIDTSFISGSSAANNSNNPTVNDDIFFSLAYLASQNRYGFTMHTPGTSALVQDPADEVSGLFGGEVVSTEVSSTENLIAFFLVVFVERLRPPTNSPAAQVKVVMRSQKINRATLRPEGNSVQLVPPKQADLLATTVFFNMFTVEEEQAATSTAGAKATAGAHVFYVEQTTSCRSSSLKAFHMNTETGKKNSGFSTLISCSDPIIQPGSKLLYGLSAQAIPGS